MGCAQGRCATRLRYAPTSYNRDSKTLSCSPTSIVIYRRRLDAYWQSALEHRLLLKNGKTWF